MTIAPTLIPYLERAVRRGLGPLRVREALRLSQWAAEHFYLSAESSYVEQRWKAYPFQVTIMDCMSNDDIEELYIKKSARVGYTKMLLASTAYDAEHRHRNQAIWQPTDDDSDDFCKTELEPMLRDVPIMQQVFPHYLQRHKDNTLKQKKFLGSVLHLRGGKAAKNYRRLTLDSGKLDEVDGFDNDIEGEGDPIALAKKRLEGATFKKLTVGSTPKLKHWSQIDTGYQGAEKRLRYHVPCPHCGEEHPLTWGGADAKHGMKWTRSAAGHDASTAAQLCPHCGALYTQADYLRVWEQGRWKADDGTFIDREGNFRDATGMPCAAPRSVGIHVWTAYSPQTTWAAIVEEFLKAVEKKRAGDKSKLKTFTNTTLGETWEEDVEEADGNALKERAEAYALRTVPLGCLVLVAGVDVQDNRFHILVWGIGVGEEMWLIDRVVLDANPDEERDWLKLDAYLQTTFPHAGGQTLKIEATAIDTGGHFTHQAYNFCRTRSRRRVFAIRGESKQGRPVKAANSMVDVNRDGKIIKHGVKLWFVGTDTAKDLLFGRLKLTTPGPGYVHFSRDLGADFYEQLTSEVRAPQKTAQGEVHRWSKKSSGVRNEDLDCTVYAIFASHALDLHKYTAKMWEKLTAAVQPVNADLFTAPPPVSTAAALAAPHGARPGPAITGTPGTPGTAAAGEPQSRRPVGLRTGISLANWGRAR